jgi:endonuclease YncB( thermonuclease family)
MKTLFSRYQHQLLITILTLTLLLLACVPPAAETEVHSLGPASDISDLVAQTSFQSLKGKVVSVPDGDTIVILNAKNETFKIRLKGIDAPESGQPFGQRAKQRLSTLVFNQNVVVEWNERDRYGRILGKVQKNGQDICLKMIQNGFAWHFKRFEQSQTEEDRINYSEAEEISRQQEIGLWTDPNPIPPWDYRSQTKYQ